MKENMLFIVNQVEIYHKEFVAKGTINDVEAPEVSLSSVRFWRAVECIRSHERILVSDALLRRNIARQTPRCAELAWPIFAGGDAFPSSIATLYRLSQSSSKKRGEVLPAVRTRSYIPHIA
jgi:hypothetical protein